LDGVRAGLVAHAASVNVDLEHACDIISAVNGCQLAALFGPQHGLTTHTQDNMIEWEGDGHSQGTRIFSLYGQARKPTPDMLASLDLLIFDLQDVGSRYYTYIQTLSLCMEACGEAGIPLLVLDRPNPVGGDRLEGPVLQHGFRSFVGLHPIAVRHGLTTGELALMFRAAFGVTCKLEIALLNGWQRQQLFADTRLPWVMPSPNMPTFDTALVYPGMCLLEGTNLSEGRGTTRPFELFGAPFINSAALVKELRGYELPGVRFRPVTFQPTFQKWAGQLCGGAQIHVTDNILFRPVLTATAILRTIIQLYPNEFAWRQPPYEYEETLLPFDILAGTDRLRQDLMNAAPLAHIQEWLDADADEFRRAREEFLLY